MSTIQAVLFPVSKWTEWLAEHWLKEHRIVPMKAVHITSKYLRYRIADPKRFKSFAMVPNLASQSMKGTNPRFVIGFF
jgi:hypothetical protein